MPIQNPSLEEPIQVIHKYAPNFRPKIGLILGSGLSSLTDAIENPKTIPYQAIPGLSAGSVDGHASLLMLGYLNGVPVACMKGRLHLYEGTSFTALRILVRTFKLLGCESLIVTGAVGSLRKEAGPGSLVMLTDHINLQFGNPLVGPNDESFGPRFVGMEDAYDPDLRERLLNVANRNNIPLHQGVYFSVLGPSFETPAEINAYRTLGADVVGMSVVPEVIIARHCDLKVLGLTVVTNYAAGMSEEKITHEGTLHYARQAERNVTSLIGEYIKDFS